VQAACRKRIGSGGKVRDHLGGKKHFPILEGTEATGGARLVGMKRNRAGGNSCQVDEATTRNIEIKRHGQQMTRQTAGENGPVSSSLDKSDIKGCKKGTNPPYDEGRERKIA